MSRTRRAALRVTALLVASALLTGCQASLAIDIRVDARGGGQLTVTLGADRELLAAAAEAGADPLGELADVVRGLEAQGWQATETVGAAGGRQIAVAGEFDDAEEFNALAAELIAALDAPEVRLLEELRLHAGQDEVRLEGVAALQPGSAVTEFGIEPEQAVALIAEHDAFAYTVSASLPGTLLDTNADGLDMPLRWEVASGERVQLLAVAEPPGTRWWVVAVAMAALVVLTATVWALSVSRRRRQAEPPRA